MTFKLPDLPYDRTALEPHISAKTLDYHHGKHHKAYVDKLNKAIKGTAYEGQTLEDIITRSQGSMHTNVFNNASQAWNHAFLWQSMSPEGGGSPSGPLKESLDRQFGDLERFAHDFKQAAVGQFGSGWAWLVLDQGKLKVVSTANADCPIADGQKPLLTLDVWEHAYYLDFQNDRGTYVDGFLQHLINWEFASANYSARRMAA